jgi:hypothetical protein
MRKEGDELPYVNAGNLKVRIPVNEKIQMCPKVKSQTFPISIALFIPCII